MSDTWACAAFNCLEILCVHCDERLQCSYCNRLVCVNHGLPINKDWVKCSVCYFGENVTNIPNRDRRVTEPAPIPARIGYLSDLAGETTDEDEDIETIPTYPMKDFVTPRPFFSKVPY